MSSQTKSNKKNGVYLIIAIILVAGFVWVWWESLQAITKSQEDIIKKNNDTMIMIDNMSCPQLGDYIARHGYLYPYASERWHGTC